jgi:excisionase family DNA binding protein
MRHRPVTYSVEEAADLLGISSSKLYRCVRDGELEASRVGRRIVIPASALERFLGAPVDDAAGDITHRDEGLNHVVLGGRLVSDPVVRTSRAGKPYAVIRLAVRRPRDCHAVHVEIVAFGARAEVAAELIREQLVRVDGRLAEWEWTASDGTRRRSHRVVAERLQALDGASRQTVAS